MFPYHVSHSTAMLTCASGVAAGVMGWGHLAPVGSTWAFPAMWFAVGGRWWALAGTPLVTVASVAFGSIPANAGAWWCICTCYQRIHWLPASACALATAVALMAWHWVRFASGHIPSSDSTAGDRSLLLNE